jgi:hypothetical protein
MLDSAKLHLPDYIIFLQEELIVRNEELLERHADVPHFAIENVPSRMNYKSTFVQHDVL